MSARLLAALACALVSGCLPLYRGRSPDGAHRVEVLELGGRQRVLVDGAPGPDGEGVGVDAIAFSDDGSRMAYPLFDGAQWSVVDRGRRGRAWDGIGAIVISDRGTHLAYVAERGEHAHVVVDERVSAPYDEVVRGSLVLGERRVAWIARRAERALVVLDGREEPPCESASELSLSADARVVAWAERQDARAWIAWRSDAGPTRRAGPYLDALPPVLSERGARAAWIARQDEGWSVFVDGERAYGPARELFALRVSADGSQWAAVEPELRRERVVIDGAPQPWSRAIEAEALAFVTGAGAVWIAREGDAELVVTSGARGGAYADIRELIGEGGRLAYLGQRDDGRVDVVVDHEVIATEASAHDLRVTSSRVLWIADGQGGSVVASQGARQPLGATALAGTLVVEGEHWACLVADRAAHRLEIALEGRARASFDVGELVWSLLAEDAWRHDPERAERAARVILRAELRSLDVPALSTR